MHTHTHTHIKSSLRKCERANIVVSEYHVKSGGFIILDYYLIYRNGRKEREYAIRICEARTETNIIT